MATSKKKKIHRCTVRVTGSDTVDLFLERHENHQAAADRLEVMMENWMVFDDVRVRNTEVRVTKAEAALSRAGKLLRSATVHLCSVGPHEGCRRATAQMEVVSRAKLYDAAAAWLEKTQEEIECGYAPTQRRYIES